MLDGGSIRYIGICQDLSKRFNGGYGIISPRKCYKGGQSTNCKVNRRILDTAKGGGSVDLYFYPTPQRKALEKCLIALYLPPWNGRPTIDARPAVGSRAEKVSGQDTGA